MNYADARRILSDKPFMPGAGETPSEYDSRVDAFKRDQAAIDDENRLKAEREAQKAANKAASDARKAESAREAAIRRAATKEAKNTKSFVEDTYQPKVAELETRKSEIEDEWKKDEEAAKPRYWGIMGPDPAAQARIPQRAKEWQDTQAELDAWHAGAKDLEARTRELAARKDALDDLSYAADQEKITGSQEEKDKALKAAIQKRLTKDAPEEYRRTYKDELSRKGYTFSDDEQDKNPDTSGANQPQQTTSSGQNPAKGPDLTPKSQALEQSVAQSLEKEVLAGREAIQNQDIAAQIDKNEWKTLTPEQKRAKITDLQAKKQEKLDAYDAQQAAMGPDRQAIIENARGMAPVTDVASEAVKETGRRAAQAGVALYKGVQDVTLGAVDTLSMVEAAARGVRPEDTNTHLFAQGARQQTEEWMGKNPEENGVASLAQGIGSSMAFLPAGVFGGIPGVIIAGAGQAFGPGYFDALNIAKEKGIEITDAQAYFRALIAAGLGSTEALPISRAFDRLDKMTGGAFKVLIDPLKEGGEEFIQEFSQNVLQDAYDKITGLNDKAWTKILGDGWDAGKTAALAGVLMGVTMNAAAQRDWKARYTKQSDILTNLDENTKHMTAQAVYQQGAEALNLKNDRVVELRNAVQEMEAKITPATPEAERQRIAKDLEAARKELGEIEVTPETIQIAADLTTGTTANFSANEAEVSTLRAEMEAMKPSRGTFWNPTDYEALTNTQAKLAKALTVREQLYKAEHTEEESARFQSVLGAAKDISKFPDAPSDPDGNGKTPGSSQRAIATAIWKAANGMPLTPAEMDLKAGKSGRVFKIDNKSGTIQVANDYVKTQMEAYRAQLQAAAPGQPITNQILAAYEKASQPQPIVRPVQAQEGISAETQGQTNPAAGSPAGPGSGPVSASPASPGIYRVGVSSTVNGQPVEESGTVDVEANSEQEALAKVRSGEIEGPAIAGNQQFAVHQVVREPQATTQETQSVETQGENASPVAIYESPDQLAASINSTIAPGYQLVSEISKYGHFSGNVVISHNGENIGRITIDYDHSTGEVRINKSDISEAHRGKSLARLAYTQINQALVAKGLPALRSDNRSLTAEAVRVWKSLEKRGLARQREDGVRGFEFVTPQQNQNPVVHSKVAAEKIAEAKKATDAIVRRLMPLFRGVDYIYDPNGPSSAGMRYLTDTGILEINAAYLDTVNKEQIRRVAVEEALHAALVSANIDAAGVWTGITDVSAMKALIQAYPSLASGSDYQRGHEFLRLFLQKKIDFTADGRILWDDNGNFKTSEEAARDVNLIRKVRDAIGKIVEYIESILNGITDTEANKEIKRAYDVAKERFEWLSRITNNEQQQQEKAPEQAPVEVPQPDRAEQESGTPAAEQPAEAEQVAPEPEVGDIAKLERALSEKAFQSVNVPIGQFAAYLQGKADSQKAGTKPLADKDLGPLWEYYRAKGDTARMAILDREMAIRAEQEQADQAQEEMNRVTPDLGEKIKGKIRRTGNPKQEQGEIDHMLDGMDTFTSAQKRRIRSVFVGGSDATGLPPLDILRDNLASEGIEFETTHDLLAAVAEWIQTGTYGDAALFSQPATPAETNAVNDPFALGSQYAVPPEDIKYIKEYAFGALIKGPTDTYEGRNAWLTPSGKWINVDQHYEAIPEEWLEGKDWFRKQDMTYYDAMFAAGFVRVTDSMMFGGNEVYAHHAGMTNLQRRTVRDAAIERGREFKEEDERRNRTLSSQPGRNYESMEFVPPFETPFGQILEYHWMNDGRSSDWNQAKTNPYTGRQIVHHFSVRTPRGDETTVSLETAMGRLNDAQRSSLTKIIKAEQTRRQEAASGQGFLFSQKAGYDRADALKGVIEQAGQESGVSGFIVKIAPYDRTRSKSGAWVVTADWPKSRYFSQFTVASNLDGDTIEGGSFRVSVGDQNLPEGSRGKGFVTAIVKGINELTKNGTLKQDGLNVHIPINTDKWRYLVKKGGMEPLFSQDPQQFTKREFARIIREEKPGINLGKTFWVVATGDGYIEEVFDSEAESRQYFTDMATDDEWLWKYEDGINSKRPLLTRGVALGRATGPRKPSGALYENPENLRAETPSEAGEIPRFTPTFARFEGQEEPVEYHGGRNIDPHGKDKGGIGRTQTLKPRTPTQFVLFSQNPANHPAEAAQLVLQFDAAPKPAGIPQQAINPDDDRDLAMRRRDAVPLTPEQAKTVEENMGLAGMIANKAVGFGWDREEAMQEASIALMRAVRTFDPSRGVKLSTYASQVMTRHLISQNSRLSARNARFTDSLDATIGDNEDGATMKDMVSQDLGRFTERPDEDGIRKVAEVLATIPAKVQKMLRLYGAGMTHEEIAQEFGITRQGVQQAIARGAEVMRKRLEAAGITRTTDVFPEHGISAPTIAEPARTTTEDESDSEVIDPRETTALGSQAANQAFYSRMEQAINAKAKGRFASPDQLKAIVNNPQEVKAEEVKWSGIIPKIDELAQANGGKVPMEELRAWMTDEGRVRFKEVTLGSTGKAREKTVKEVRKYTDSEGDTNWTIEYTDGTFIENVYADTEQEAITQAIEMDDEASTTESTADNSKYAKYTLPGGENYREVVLASPDQNSEKRQRLNKLITTRNWTEAERAEAKRLEAELGGLVSENATYTSQHFPNIPNYVAHIRMNDRTDSEGRPGTFIEEIQSDRHQKGRELGYAGDPGSEQRKYDFAKRFYFQVWRPNQLGKITQQEAQARWDAIGDEASKEGISKIDIQETGAKYGDFTRTPDKGVPDAPHRKDWPLALFKRALRDAVAAGHDWIGWTSGETQAERYDLSKQIKEVSYYYKDGDATGQLVAVAIDGRNAMNERNVAPDKLEDYIGKDVARKLMEAPENDGMRNLSGLELQVGGEGMKGFYDRMLPKEIQAYVKQWKAQDGSVPQVERGRIQIDKEYPDAMIAQGFGTIPIWRVNITPAMREGVQTKGQALFSQGIINQTDAEIAARILKRARSDERVLLKHAITIKGALAKILPNTKVSYAGDAWGITVAAGEHVNEMGNIDTIPAGEHTGVYVSISRDGETGMVFARIAEINVGERQRKTGIATKMLEAISKAGIPVYHSFDMSNGFWDHIKKARPELFNRTDGSLSSQAASEPFETVTPEQARAELGRAQPDDALVLTPTGWWQAGALLKGDQILDEHGNQQTVEATYDQGEIPVFKITTESGRTTEASADHLWKTNQEPEIMTTETLKPGMRIPVVERA